MSVNDRVHTPCAPQAPEQYKQPQQKAGVPDPVDNKRLLAGAGLLIVGVPEADQQVGAQPHPFPTDKQQQQVLGHDQHQHGGGKQVEIGKIARHVRILGHVADRVDVDQKADPGNDQDHDRGQGIDPQGKVDVQLSGRNPRKHPVNQRPAVGQLKKGGHGQQKRSQDHTRADRVDRPAARPGAVKHVEHHPQQGQQDDKPQVRKRNDHSLVHSLTTGAGSVRPH